MGQRLINGSATRIQSVMNWTNCVRPEERKITRLKNPVVGRRGLQVHRRMQNLLDFPGIDPSHTYRRVTDQGLPNGGSLSPRHRYEIDSILLGVHGEGRGAVVTTQ